MDKVKVKLVFLGNPRHKLDLKKIKGLDSKFFEVVAEEYIKTLPEPKKNDGYLDVEYTVPEIIETVGSVSFDGVVIAIMNYRFDDGFYLHRLRENQACLSIAGIDRLLLDNHISLENFIIKNIYELILFKNIFSDMSSNEAYKMVHQDTRGCLFDLNGDQTDVIHNTEKPIICDECKAFINSKSTSSGFIGKFESELKKIKKPLISSVELFIKKYPLFSVSLTLFSSFLISVLAGLFVAKVT